MQTGGEGLLNLKNMHDIGGKKMGVDHVGVRGMEELGADMIKVHMYEIPKE